MNESDHNHKQCLELFERLSEYLDKEIEPDTGRMIEKHLAGCPACRVCFETLKRTVHLCRGTKSPPLPDDVAKRLQRWAQSLQR